MNVFHLTGYPGEPLRRIDRERLGKRLSQYGGNFTVHFHRTGFRRRSPGYPKKQKQKEQWLALTPERTDLGQVGKHAS